MNGRPGATICIMLLVRAWKRRLLGGLGAAAVAPGMLIGALAVLGLAGGFASFGALSQAFSGPGVPAAQRFSASLLRGEAFPLPAVPATAAAGGTSLAGAAGSPAGGSAMGNSGTAGGSLAGRNGGGTAGGGLRGGGPGPVSGPGGAQPASTSSPGASPPGSTPTVVDQVGVAGTGITSQLPPPLAPLVSDVGSATSSVEQVLSGGGGHGGTAPTGSSSARSRAAGGS